MKKAVYPGSFDPVTIGHLDIIERASKKIDHIIVAILNNSQKKSFFTLEERIAMLNKSTAHIPNIRICSFNGLLADFVKKEKAEIIIRGLRAVSDFEYEFKLALMNRKLAPEIETIFMCTSTENMFISSSIVKEVALLGGDISGQVPDIIMKDIKKLITKYKETIKNKNL